MAGDQPMSVAFRPTPKDERHLSTDQGRISPEESFRGYESRTNVRPDSTWGVAVGCILDAHACLPDAITDTVQLEVIDDGGSGDLHDGHASVIFPDYDGATASAVRKHDERIARELKKDALSRGRLHPPTT